MKKTLITLFILTFSLNSFSQKEDRKERIKALKIAFITERLDLSKEEAQKFWPIYNTFEEEENKLRRESYGKRKDINIETLSEQEARTMLNEMASIENKKHKLKETFLNDLQKILSAKKIIILKVTEDAFNRRMLEEMKKRKEEYRKNKP